VFIEAKDDGSGGDNWSYKSCKAPVTSAPLGVKSLKSSEHRNTHCSATFQGRDEFCSKVPRWQIAMYLCIHVCIIIQNFELYLHSSSFVY